MEVPPECSVIEGRVFIDRLAQDPPPLDFLLSLGIPSGQKILKLSLSALREKVGEATNQYVNSLWAQFIAQEPPS